MKKVFAIFSLVVVLASCKSFKGGSRGNEEPVAVDLNNIKSVIAGIKGESFEFQYLSFKGRGLFEGMGVRQNLTLNVRMKRHEKVWISVTALFGIEAARLLVTEDSAFILQKFPDIKYRAISLDSLSQYTAVPMTVTQFQNFLVGNPVGNYENARSSMKNDELWVEQTIGKVLLQELIHSDNIKIGQLKAFDNQQQSELQVDYGDFQQEGTKLLPHKVSILVSSKEINAKSALTYSNISKAEINSFPFTKPQ